MVLLVDWSEFYYETSNSANVNHAQNSSWNQPVLSNKGKVSCSRKQAEVWLRNTSQTLYPPRHATGPAKSVLKAELYCTYSAWGLVFLDGYAYHWQSITSECTSGYWLTGNYVWEHWIHKWKHTKQNWATITNYTHVHNSFRPNTVFSFCV